MTGFLLIAGLCILLAVLLGLALLLPGRGDPERLMATQLLGTGGVAALILFGSATDLAGALDLALLLALVAAFSAVAFVASLSVRPPDADADAVDAAGARGAKQAPAED